MKRIGKNKSNIGILGEDISVKWLKNKGFLITAQNFKTYHGEIDIIANKLNVTHFIEVKSIDISHGTARKINPKDNFTRAKSLKMQKAIEYYLISHPGTETFKTLLLCVCIDTLSKNAKIECIENPFVE